MTPRGASALLDMRTQGQRPAGVVWVNCGNFREPYWWKWSNTLHTPEILVRPEDSIDGLDLRCLVDLDLILFADGYSKKLIALFDRLIKYAAHIQVLITEFGVDVGWSWDREYGRFDFNTEHLATKYREAMADSFHAAHSNNPEIYRLARVAEQKAREANNG